jgi:tripartite ATP-independent transporter DctP family solute receptor
MKTSLIRRSFLASAAAALTFGACLSVQAQDKTVIRVSTAAVPADWHGKMWTVFKDELNRTAPGRFDVQINLNGTLFKQGTEPAAMARGNLEMSTVSAFDMAKQAPEFSILTAGYIIRDPDQLMKVLSGPIGEELYKKASEKLDITVLSPLYLGTRQLNLRELRNVRTPADLKGVKLRMPASKEWLFLGEALGATPTPLAFGEVYLGLKTGTIDGQDNPLPSVRSAKFYEVTKQITLTNHLVDGLFISLSNKIWNGLNADLKSKVKSAAQLAAKYNNENRLKEESEILDFFKSQGLVVTTPDQDAVRKAVQGAYLKSEYVKEWTPGMLDRINSTR